MHRRGAQNAVDLGALAGTQVIAKHHLEGGAGGSDVWNAIDATVRQNGCTGATFPCDWEADYIRPSAGGEESLGPVVAGAPIPDDAQGVEVRVDAEPPTYFLPISGRDEWHVGTEAAALTASFDSTSNNGILLPIGVDPRLIPWPGSPECAANPPCVEEGTPLVFSLGMDRPGNFSWLTWFGPVDAGELADNICEPRNPGYTFPVWIEGDVGKTNAAAVRACLEKYIGQEVLVPIWDQAEKQGNNARFRVVGVVALVLEGFEKEPAIDHLKGAFQRVYSYAGVPPEFGGPPCSLSEEGCVSKSYFLGLIR
jgi:hypothetical protein